MISAADFFALERRIIESGLGSDKDPFEAIKSRLVSPPALSPDDFARECAYVILAGGFNQAVAKRKYAQICEILRDGVSEGEIFALFANQNKARAIARIWNNRAKFRDGFYARETPESKIAYLATLPHIGRITCHHLARNLGISVVKYDLWIQRLGIREAGLGLEPSFPLNARVKAACDAIFESLEASTGLPRGYIDVVLWKACQKGLIASK
jgi:hypothetical protein